jgi:hypothetical protein
MAGIIHFGIQGKPFFTAEARRRRGSSLKASFRELFDLQ